MFNIYIYITKIEVCNMDLGSGHSNVVTPNHWVCNNRDGILTVQFVTSMICFSLDTQSLRRKRSEKLSKMH